MYTSAGIPGTGIYAVRHIRSSAGKHPNVLGSAVGCVAFVVVAVITLVLVAVIYSSR
jgi:hypothetical protein